MNLNELTDVGGDAACETDLSSTKGCADGCKTRYR